MLNIIFLPMNYIKKYFKCMYLVIQKSNQKPEIEGQKIQWSRENVQTLTMVHKTT